MLSWQARLQLTLVALLVLLLTLTPYPRAFTEAMRQASALRTSREYGAALESYQQASRLDRESPLPWLRMGEVLLQQHRFSQATIVFLEAEYRGAKHWGLPPGDTRLPRSTAGSREAALLSAI